MSTVEGFADQSVKLVKGLRQLLRLGATGLCKVRAPAATPADFLGQCRHQLARMQSAMENELELVQAQYWNK